MKNSLLFVFMIPLITAFSIPADCNGVCWEANSEVWWTESETLADAWEIETVALDMDSPPAATQLSLTQETNFSLDFISNKDKKDSKKDKKNTKKAKKHDKKSSKSSSKEAAKKPKASKQTAQSAKNSSKASTKKTSSSLPFMHKHQTVAHESSQADYQVPKAGR